MLTPLGDKHTCTHINHVLQIWAPTGHRKSLQNVHSLTTTDAYVVIDGPVTAKQSHTYLMPHTTLPPNGKGAMGMGGQRKYHMPPKTKQAGCADDKLALQLPTATLATWACILVHMPCPDPPLYYRQ